MPKNIELTRGQQSFHVAHVPLTFLINLWCNLCPWGNRLVPGDGNCLPNFWPRTKPVYHGESSLMCPLQSLRKNPDKLLSSHRSATSRRLSKPDAHSARLIAQPTQFSCFSSRPFLSLAEHFRALFRWHAAMRPFCWSLWNTNFQSSVCFRRSWCPVGEEKSLRLQ